MSAKNLNRIKVLQLIQVPLSVVVELSNPVSGFLAGFKVQEEGTLGSLSMFKQLIK